VSGRQADSLVIWTVSLKVQSREGKEKVDEVVVSVRLESHAGYVLRPDVLELSGLH
jgi:hypothetical protein